MPRIRKAIASCILLLFFMSVLLPLPFSGESEKPLNLSGAISPPENSSGFAMRSHAERIAASPLSRTTAVQTVFLTVGIFLILFACKQRKLQNSFPVKRILSFYRTTNEREGDD